MIAELTAVKGIGEWSAHMFLMFHLGRPDVLAVGDLGLRRAVMLRYELPDLPDAGDAGADRRAVAPAPDAGVPLPLALARCDPGLGTRIDRRATRGRSSARMPEIA